MPGAILECPMHTCEICDAPLRTASNESVSHGTATYHVCSYTCETVLRERFAPTTTPATTDRLP